MTVLSLKILLVLLTTAVMGKTLRFQIVTRDDGTKEIINPSTGATPSPDVRFLARDLNLSLDNGSEDANQLISKWNTYTADGWSHRKDFYSNSTKLVAVDKKKPEARSEDNQMIIEPAGFWDMIRRLYDCFRDEDTEHDSSLVCLKNRMTTMFLSLMDDSFNKSGVRAEKKTLDHGKKLLKGALLPLLVLLVIKYLVALPVIAAGLITIKTFWLSLLSAGVAAFGAPWKQEHVLKRFRPDGDHGHSPAWVADLRHEIDSTEKYFM